MLPSSLFIGLIAVLGVFMGLSQGNPQTPDIPAFQKNPWWTKLLCNYAYYYLCANITTSWLSSLSERWLCYIVKYYVYVSYILYGLGVSATKTRLVCIDQTNHSCALITLSSVALGCHSLTLWFIWAACSEMTLVMGDGIVWRYRMMTYMTWLNRQTVFCTHFQLLMLIWSLDFF